MQFLPVRQSGTNSHATSVHQQASLRILHTLSGTLYPQALDLSDRRILSYERIERWLTAAAAQNLAQH